MTPKCSILFQWIFIIVASPASSTRPNLLLLFPDEWRWDWSGFDEADLRVPTLKALASGGTRFTQAYTPAPVCQSARACLAAAMEYDQIGAMGFDDFPLNQTTWFTILQQAGYHTMTAGKDDLTKRTGVGEDGNFHARELGFSDWNRTEGKSGVFKQQAAHEPYGEVLETQSAKDLHGSVTSAYLAGRQCYGDIYQAGQCCHTVNETLAMEWLGPGIGSMPQNVYDCYEHDVLEDELYIDTFVGRAAGSLIERAPIGKPWALHVSFPGPHPPFIITKSMNASIAGRTFPIAADNSALNPQIQVNIRRQYAAEVENLDTVMGALLDKLRALGELENTLVVVTSDHGEELGDHKNFGKARPWEGSSHVPLIVNGPGVAANRVVQRPVTTLDVIGTFMELAKAQPTPNMTAQSLWPLLSANSHTGIGGYRSYVSSGLNNWRMIVRQFNSSSTLKLVCCEGDCPSNAPSNVPQRKTEQMTILLLNMTADAFDMADILDKGENEATEMVKLLPAPYAEKCGFALRNLVGARVII